MKFSRETVEYVFEKSSLARPSLLYRFKMHCKIIHAINQQHISYFSGFRLLVPRAISVMTVFLIVMTSSMTTLYAYNNPHITSGDPLYALKAGVESIETVIAITPEQKAAVFSKMANRRSEEAKIIAEKTGSINSKVIQEVKNNNEKAISHTKNIVQSAHKEETKANLVTSSNTQKQNLKKVKDIVVTKAIEEKKIDKDIFSLEDKEAIFISAPVSMENISVRDEMLIEEGKTTEYGLVEEGESSVVISGFSPNDGDLLTEEDLIKDNTDMKLVESTLEDVEEISTKESLDRMLEETEEETFIN